jgi:hypothetical protein
MDVTQFSKTTLLLTAMAISSPLVSGCYPRPHRYTNTPEISGVVRKSGVPVNGARVLLAQTRGDDGNYCRDARVVAVTTEDGRFKVAANTELHFFTSLLNPPNSVAQMTSVCFEIPAHLKLGVLLLARTDRETSIVLSCDLDSPPVEFKQGVVWQKDKWGICQNPG